MDAVAKNGIQLKVKARVTVRANLQRLIGGATEETIIARVGEGIVSAIGSSETHKARAGESGPHFEAVLTGGSTRRRPSKSCPSTLPTSTSGDNIGARLQADQAEADTRVARARAEGRRAMAAAAEQEKLAGIEESRATLVQAEAEVPRAIADAFSSGRLGLMDYYKLRNVQADTDMRRSFAGTGISTNSQRTG